MAKNYSSNTSFEFMNIRPRKIVVDRILAFSKAYPYKKRESEAIDLLKKESIMNKAGTHGTLMVMHLIKMASKLEVLEEIQTVYLLHGVELEHIQSKTHLIQTK